jgi:hypothetical protein
VLAEVLGQLSATQKTLIEPQAVQLAEVLGETLNTHIATVPTPRVAILLALHELVAHVETNLLDQQPSCPHGSAVGGR